MDDRRRKKRQRRAYDQLRAEVLDILFDADPIGIILPSDGIDMRDEYGPEVSTILPRLSSAANEDDVAEIIHLEFQRWFGKTTAGPRLKYRTAAPAVWEAWNRCRARMSVAED